MSSRVQQLAANVGMSYDEFVGEMRKRGCSEPTASKIWNGTYETYYKFSDKCLKCQDRIAFAKIAKNVRCQFY